MRRLLTLLPVPSRTYSRPFMLPLAVRLMGDWIEEKAKEMSRGGVFGHCDNCGPLVRFDGDKCVKCGTVKK